ncbi:hypothetical protein D3C74_139800 [compost metagenome]
MNRTVRYGLKTKVCSDDFVILNRDCFRLRHITIGFSLQRIVARYMSEAVFACGRIRFHRTSGFQYRNRSAGWKTVEPDTSTIHRCFCRLHFLLEFTLFSACNFVQRELFFRFFQLDIRLRYDVLGHCRSWNAQHTEIVNVPAVLVHTVIRFQTEANLNLIAGVAIQIVINWTPLFPIRVVREFAQLAPRVTIVFGHFHITVIIAGLNFKPVIEGQCCVAYSLQINFGRNQRKFSSVLIIAIKIGCPHIGSGRCVFWSYFLGNAAFPFILGTGMSPAIIRAAVKMIAIQRIWHVYSQRSLIRLDSFIATIILSRHCIMIGRSTDRDGICECQC